jgi:ribosomal protein S12 methylthiotransferase accessory factor
MQMQIHFNGNKQVYSTYKGYTVSTDQPKDEGGDGTAPEPYDLFLASIGTCAGVYVAYFCEKRGIPTDGIAMTLEAQKNEKTHLFDHIRIRVGLPPDFPEKYRGAVLKAADMCTVKRSLFDPPQIEVTAD